jgi:hypothetical protein
MIKNGLEAYPRDKTFFSPVVDDVMLEFAVEAFGIVMKLVSFEENLAEKLILMVGAFQVRKVNRIVRKYLNRRKNANDQNRFRHGL